MADDQAADLPSGLQMTALDPDYRRDPYARLSALRAACPVRRDPAFGSVFLTRYADVRAVLTDRTLWRDPLKGDETSIAYRRAMMERAENPGGRVQSILTSDDPDHARVRGLITPVFYKRVSASRREVEEVVEGHVRALQDRDGFDVISDYAIPIPIEVIARILGVGSDRLEEFRAWSEAIIHTFNPARSEAQTVEMKSAGAAADAYFTELMETRRRAPEDDLVSDLTGLQRDGAQISDEEIRINLMTLLIAGNLTTTDVIGNGVRLFLTRRDQLERLLAEPELASAAVEEVLRYDPPVDSTGRVASHEMRIRDEPIRDREALTVVLRAANRDPEAFEDPDRFDITRPRAPHVAFGGGAHICLGAPLARMEAQAAFVKLFQAFPDLELEDEEPRWRALPFFRGLEGLKVRRSGRARG